jgi:hypothetical protein
MKFFKKTSKYFFLLAVFFLAGMPQPPAGGYNDCIKGSGKLKTENRNILNFNSIEIDGAFDLVVVCQKKKSLKISGDDNLLKHIITRVKGNKLHIYSNAPICSEIQIVVNIEIENIEAVTSSGAVDIDVSNLDNNNFSLEISGSGDIDLQGTTCNFTTVLSGSSELHAKNFRATNVRIKINGASDAHVYASQKLDVEIGGAGTLFYSGNPVEITQNITGVGELIRD